jgi:hypothetical protein
LKHILWHDEHGLPIACLEKIKVMQQNTIELYQVLIDFYEDAILMGVSALQVQDFLLNTVDSLNNGKNND